MALDVLKVIAAILITNSHFRVLYEDVNPAFATGGVPGDALFFFTAGFALTLGKSAKQGYVMFVKNKMRRLLPTFLIWNLMANMFAFKDISWKDFLLVPEYWFIQCIFVLYLLIYPFLRMNKKTFFILTIISILIMLSVMLIYPYPDRSVFNDTSLRYYCYLTPFIFGLYCGINNVKLIRAKKWRDGLIGILFFCLYFVFISFGKCEENWRYYTEIFSLIPLNLFMFYLYRFFSQEKLIDRIYNNKWLYRMVKFVSTLTLQIYVVQFYLITDDYNHLFPLNIVLMFAIIFTVAYLLNVFTKLFEQTLSSEAWSIKKALHI